MLGFFAHYWLLLMPFYFRKECPLNSGYLTLTSLTQKSHKNNKILTFIPILLSDYSKRDVCAYWQSNYKNIFKRG
ncbi:hypothetical protein FQF72_21660 [Escherichia coli]|nr:hypothetical protein [Escherichia coli]